ncbi:site-specific DNA-methyltransferase [Oculatella sp. LEGE 06141]|uniref:DNA-methyltransferase n=1 Tax=Oculatella sp. LEGE 06141 TaxID=1828648 RepID=UPI001880BE0F|nr:site-specific DNA-methyltransferase [Oculatella sp. LEGE 06141]MBE9178618.1 site-specific DNA-methyltransferase [Oculatella sp. LEGE 06141]
MSSALPMNQVVLGEAIEVMRSLPDGCIDALISDPPYNTTNFTWDTKVDWQLFWSEAERICKPKAIKALFAQQPFATELIVSNRKQFRYELVWEKPMALGFLDANIRPLRCHELILVFCHRFRGKDADSRCTYNPQKTPGKPYKAKSSEHVCQHYGRHAGRKTDNTGDRYPRDVLKFNNVSGGFRNGEAAYHPTQKPLELMKWLVLSYTDLGGVVLDPFSGSGSTAAACLTTGRNFIAVERDPKFHAASIQRLSQIHEEVQCG